MPKKDQQKCNRNIASEEKLNVVFWVSNVLSDSFVKGKTKLLTYAGRWHKQKSQETLMQKLHCAVWSLVTLSLLRLPYCFSSVKFTEIQKIQVQVGKEPVCTQGQWHFTRIKCQYVLCTVMKIELYVLWMHHCALSPQSLQTFILGLFILLN